MLPATPSKAFKVALVGCINAARLCARMARGIYQEKPELGYEVPSLQVHDVSLRLFVDELVYSATANSTSLKGARIVLFVYDAHDEASYKSITDGWFIQVQRSCLKSPPALFLVACMDEKASLDTVKAKQWAAGQRIAFFEVNLKSGTGISALLESMARSCHSPSPTIPKWTSFQKVVQNVRTSSHLSTDIIEGEVQIGVRLGSGAGGQVFAAVWAGNRVALKLLSDGTALKAEASTMKALRHPNCVSFFGLYMAADERLFLVMEICEEGSLQDLLRRQECSLEQLSMFASQVAHGLDYLHSKDILHRDLAARNVLIDRKGSSFIAKITDFGLSKHSPRPILGGNRQDSKAEAEMLPIRWTAPETFQGKFTARSDIWAYGILLWELFSRGSIPYPDLLTNEKVVAFVVWGHRMKPPPSCPPAFANLMLQCWVPEPRDRPCPLAPALPKHSSVLPLSLPGISSSEARNTPATGAIYSTNFFGQK